jgi:hypothetical protein
VRRIVCRVCAEVFEVRAKGRPPVYCSAECFRARKRS